jgi:hypothetical protein
MVQPLPQNVERLLQILQGGSDSSREAAVEELGRLKIRDERIIIALKKVVVSDKRDGNLLK